MPDDNKDKPPDGSTANLDPSFSSSNIKETSCSVSENAVSSRTCSANGGNLDTVIHDASKVDAVIQSTTMKETRQMSYSKIVGINLKNDSFKCVSDGSVNDSKGWKNFCLFAQRVDKRGPLSKTQMHPGNLAYIASNILKLEPHEVHSINWDRPHRPLIITRQKIPMDRLSKTISLPIETELRDEDSSPFKVMIDCRKLTLTKDGDHVFDVTLKYGYGKICEQALRAMLEPFCKVNSFRVGNSSVSDKASLKKFSIFNNPEYAHWNTKSSDLIINISGNPKNIPSLIPCGDEIESFEFLGQAKQCANCFMFGHFRSACGEKTKSVSFYKSWLMDRLKKVEKGEVPFFTKKCDSEQWSKGPARQSYVGSTQTSERENNTVVCDTAENSPVISSPVVDPSSHLELNPSGVLPVTDSLESDTFEKSPHLGGSSASGGVQSDDTPPAQKDPLTGLNPVPKSNTTPKKPPLSEKLVLLARTRSQSLSKRNRKDSNNGSDKIISNQKKKSRNDSE